MEAPRIHSSPTIKGATGLSTTQIWPFQTEIKTLLPIIEMVILRCWKINHLLVNLNVDQCLQYSLVEVGSLAAGTSLPT
jgi:hypothetical protein